MVFVGMKSGISRRLKQNHRKPSPARPGRIRLSPNHKYRYSALLPDFNSATTLKPMVHGIRNSDLKAASRPVILYMDCKGPKSHCRLGYVQSLYGMTAVREVIPLSVILYMDCARRDLRVVIKRLQSHFRFPGQGL